MSLLEDVLTKAAGKVLGGEDSEKAKLAVVLIPILIKLLSDGGLEKILGKMKDMGLGDEASSWVGPGESKSISGDQAAEILGGSEVEKIAGQLGLPEGQTAELLAEALPVAVDKASPDGEEPEAGSVASILEGLAK
jgi:uncharacterized protein YidB (DUF937 family)